MTTLSPRQVANSRARWQRVAAMVLVVVLPPFTLDVLLGATTVTTAIEALSEMSTFGFAALLIRAAARRREPGFRIVVVLGIAFALTVEFLIVQTSLAPLGSVFPYPEYGRAMGVNWTFLAWALGYETIWGIAIPIQLSELAFPLHRTSAWLGARGCAVLAILFVLGAGVAWYNWTQLSVPDYAHRVVYLPPLVTVLCGWVLVLVLVLVVLLLRPAQPRGTRTDSGRPAPAPVLVGIGTATGTFLWFCWTVDWVRLGAWARAVPVFVPVLLALILAGGCVVVARAWAARAGWSDRHRFAAVCGALVAVMAVGFATNDLGDPVNLIGKIVLNAFACLALLLLAGKLRRRASARAE
jgi:hypothetical protein